MTTTSRPQGDPRFTSTLERIADARHRMADLRPRRRKDLIRPPGPRTRDVWLRVARGEVPSLAFFEDLAQYRPVAYVRMPRADLYLLNDPDLIWDVYVHGPTMKGYGLQAVRPLVGDGILTSEGAKHRAHRSMVQPAFTGRRIAQYCDDMVAAVHDLDRRWNDAGTAGVARIDLVEDMSGMTLDIVGRTLFGLDLAAVQDRIGPALTHALGVFNVTMNPKWEVLSRYPSKPRRQLTHAVDTMDDVIARMITDKRAELAAGAQPRDMMSTLITARDPETGAALNDDEIRDEALTLVLAGHETTAMLLSWTWLLLQQNPAVHDWAAAEWRAVGATEGLTVDDLPRMPRTRAVLAESMRLRPPAWMLDRIATQDTEVGTYLVPRGAVMLASQHLMHRDPRFWPGADEFRPTRWLDEGGEFTEKIVPRGVYFPFGFAARRCIGDRFALTEATLALAILGSRWQVDIVDPESVQPEPSVTMRPSTSMPATVRRRV